ncbi:TPA: hypothetical protein L9K93_004744 [Klebsiella quasipneumoniae subsp. similipneumoniae]|nr:hypothetical protein [Klebsiella quasipneumoniae subsp. similipneumoniae]
MNVYEMEGFLRGKCLPGDIKVNESNAEYLVRKLTAVSELQSEVTALVSTLEKCREVSGCPAEVALQDHLRQLTAENLTMLRLLTDISENHMEYFSESEDGMFSGVPLDYVSEINMYVSRDVNAENPFPATDTYLAGIKADGATAAGDYLKLEAQHMPVVERLMMQDAAEICYGTAAKLREGEK